MSWPVDCTPVWVESSSRFPLTKNHPDSAKGTQKITSNHAITHLKVSTQAVTFCPAQQPPLLSKHSLVSIAPLRQTDGSDPTSKPEQMALSTLDGLRRPRYWLVLITTVGRKTTWPRPLPSWSILDESSAWQKGKEAG